MTADRIVSRAGRLQWPVSWLRRQYHAARRYLTGQMHPGRRRRALRALTEEASQVRSVLLVCYGNICRSPYAEAYLKLLAARDHGNITILSAGFFGPDRSANDTALRVAGRRGLDLSRHISRLVPSRLGVDCLIATMTAEQRRVLRRKKVGRSVIVLGDLDPETPTTRDIPDPYGADDETFELVFDRIDRCARVLWSVVRDAGGSTDLLSERPPARR